MPIERSPTAGLVGNVSGYYGFREDTPTTIRRREGPGPAPLHTLAHRAVPLEEVLAEPHHEWYFAQPFGD